MILKWSPTVIDSYNSISAWVRYCLNIPWLCVSGWRLEVETKEYLVMLAALVSRFYTNRIMTVGMPYMFVYKHLLTFQMRVIQSIVSLPLPPPYWQVPDHVIPGKLCIRWLLMQTFRADRTPIFSPFTGGKIVKPMVTTFGDGKILNERPPHSVLARYWLIISHKQHTAGWFACVNMIVRSTASVFELFCSSPHHSISKKQFIYQNGGR